jgi:hypothetical protein
MVGKVCIGRVGAGSYGQDAESCGCLRCRCQTGRHAYTAKIVHLLTSSLLRTTMHDLFPNSGISNTCMCVETWCFGLSLADRSSSTA